MSIVKKIKDHLIKIDDRSFLFFKRYDDKNRSPGYVAVSQAIIDNISFKMSPVTNYFYKRQHKIDYLTKMV